MKTLLISLSLFVCGVVAGYIYRGAPNLTPQLEEVPSGEAANGVDRATSAPVGAGDRTQDHAVERLRTENSALRDELARVSEQLEEVEERTQQRAEAFGQMRTQFAERRAQRQAAEANVKLAQLRSYFQLTDYQAQQVQAWHETAARSEGERMELYRQLHAGEVSEQDFRARMIVLDGQGDLTDYLQTLLTPEQASVLPEYLADLDHERRQSRAYDKLAELGRGIVLNDDQKDALFEIFYFNAEDARANQETMSLSREELRALRAQREEAETDQLRAVLTDEQLEYYGVQQRSRFRGF